MLAHITTDGAQKRNVTLFGGLRNASEHALAWARLSRSCQAQNYGFYGLHQHPTRLCCRRDRIHLQLRSHMWLNMDAFRMRTRSAPCTGDHPGATASRCKEPMSIRAIALQTCESQYRPQIDDIFFSHGVPKIVARNISQKSLLSC